MAQPVKRDWRRAKSGEVRHTREVRSETLSKEVQELLLQMATDLNLLKIKVHELEARVDPIELGIRAVAAEAAKRVA